MATPGSDFKLMCSVRVLFQFECQLLPRASIEGHRHGIELDGNRLYKAAYETAFWAGKLGRGKSHQHSESCAFLQQGCSGICSALCTKLHADAKLVSELRLNVS